MSFKDDAKDGAPALGAGVLVLIAVIIAVVVIGAVGLAVHSVTAPADIAIENRAFHAGQPYQDGMARDLENMRHEYLTTGETEIQKDAIRATIRHRFAGFEPSSLPQYDQVFLQEMMR